MERMVFKMRNAMMACALALSSSAAFAATWHVSTGGDDAAGDGSEENPVATIARAVQLGSSCARKTRGRRCFPAPPR